MRYSVAAVQLQIMATTVQKVFVGRHLIQEIITSLPEEGGEPQVDVVPGPEPEVKEAVDMEPGTSRRMARGAAPRRRV